MARWSFNDSRLIVAGASSGIGRALVLALSRQGGNAVAVARRESPLRELAGQIRDDVQCRGQIELVIGDLTDQPIRRLAVQRAVQAWGGLDGVINSAGVGAFGRFADNPPQQLRDLMELNFFAAAELIRTALPELRKSRQGIVVNVGSILGHRGLPQMSEYCASKFALQGLSQALRVELARDGIHLLVVSPGTTRTEFYDRVIHGRGQAPWSTGYAITPEAVAEATLRGIRRRRREIFPNHQGRLLVWANRWAPGLVDRALRRYA